MDSELVQAEVQYLQQPSVLRTKEDIDIYADYLTRFIQELIEKSVLWSRLLSYTQPWWTAAVQELVIRECLTRQKW